MEVVTAYGTHSALRLRPEDSPDVVVVGDQLHARDLPEFVSRLRSRVDAPMLVLGRWRDENHVAAVLDAGADDVATTPCGRVELVARVRALARRGNERPTPPGPSEADGLRVDPATREATLDGHALMLTPIEFELLARLAARRGYVVDHRSMLKAAWPDRRDVDPDLLRTHLAHLNAKLIAAGHPGIRNVRARGYALRTTP
jgi:DNA-binding response OmpR family regulator